MIYQRPTLLPESSPTLVIYSILIGIPAFESASMDLTDAEKKIVLIGVKQYRSTLYNLIKDLDDNFTSDSRNALADTLTQLTTAQKKIEASLLYNDEDPALEELEADEQLENTDKVVEFPSRDKANVLVTDDDMMTSELICSLLEDFGFTSITTAGDGEEALEKIRTAEHSFDLIICDWKMPKLTGLDVHKKLKGAGLINNTMFILLTAIVDDVLKSRALKQGINEYIIKPIDSEALEALLNRHFK